MISRIIGFCHGCGILVGSRLFCETSPKCTNCNTGFLTPQDIIWGTFDEADFMHLIHELELGKDKDYHDD